MKADGKVVGRVTSPGEFEREITTTSCGPAKTADI
jgi:hypothetical protein